MLFVVCVEFCWLAIYLCFCGLLLILVVVGPVLLSFGVVGCSHLIFVGFL